MQAGAEFVHGSNSVFADSLKASGFEFQERNWPDWWYFAKEKRLVHDEEVDGEVGKVWGGGGAQQGSGQEGGGEGGLGYEG